MTATMPWTSRTAERRALRDYRARERAIARTSGSQRDEMLAAARRG